MRVCVGCFFSWALIFCALRKAVFRSGLSGCVRSWPVYPKHNLKNMAKGAHVGTLWASRKTQASDVSCRGGEARRGGKSHCTKHRPQTGIFLAFRFLPRGTAASQLGHTSDLTVSTHQTPAVLCNHYLAGLLTHPHPPLSFWHQITLSTNLSTVDY